MITVKPERKKPMTRTGYYRIAEEHRQLLEDVRPGVVAGITIAAAEGDRSENAEYIYGKKRLREIDKKLRNLTELIRDVDIVDPENVRSDRVCFGATVGLVDEDGKTQRWTIVGVGESDVEQGTISYQSPLARVLMNRRVGDFVILQRPSGEMEYEIVELSFIAVPKGRDQTNPR